jgi:formate hydrogenlyase subunit 3/multisubunit Na+/H+ antiporter MnhD subunit
VAAGGWPTFISNVGSPVAVRREKTRSLLAYGVLSGIGVITLGIVISATLGRAPLDTLLAGIFTPLIGIAGTVIGFYFASEKNA